MEAGTASHQEAGAWEEPFPGAHLQGEAWEEASLVLGACHASGALPCSAGEEAEPEEEPQRVGQLGRQRTADEDDQPATAGSEQPEDALKTEVY